MIIRHSTRALTRASACTSTPLRSSLVQPVSIPRSFPSPLLSTSVRFNSNTPRQPYTPPEIKTKPTQQNSNGSQESSQGKPLKEKVAQAWSTPTRWYPIPLAFGALVLLVVQYRKSTRGDIEVEYQNEEGAVIKKNGKRVDGPWQVRVLGALPLRSLSQLWGYLNGLVLPVWFRPFGFKLYATIFGCNLDEVPKDLKEYESLGDFFYREMKEGQRPIADAPMVSPADGRVLHFGEIVGSRVEQVKGITYSLEALLGSESSLHGEAKSIPRKDKEGGEVVDDEHFANINDIPYSLSSLLGKGSGSENIEDKSFDDSTLPKTNEKEVDASHPTKGHELGHDASVAARLGTSALSNQTDSKGELPRLDQNNRLYFMVVYLAPGDYHRFHSPTTWVVERRRHFTGDLFSVSPYIANRMKDLFVLNERVALLGRWKHGFFSMVPVGATNVGSIKINFDETLRTNTRKITHPPHTYAEAVYSSASILKGQPLLAGEEMGGFKLGSTIVMVFEAPKNFIFDVEAGQKVKMGQVLGKFEEEGKE
ncbi:phosphatidylserine decarboxylase [Kwoniella bestiolae CBS 10118]|uniref:Phosphatidylserine decarboxylase proenzyme 1, mitochondrial n=1 Tax=Kwoniella bestiolae CBS 10118 TaxID=1296100 RepID=A0A1B9FY61_9TREE|nr:phosphatidylserine decarboxylase [Kwoniella bestiolae CBS 10118]OCF23709.1 phosphatidylserine decarboxylase [Kwoniella bestiolae CBS 10118]